MHLEREHDLEAVPGKAINEGCIRENNNIFEG